MANVFKSHPKLSWLVAFLFVAAGTVAALELTDTTYFFHEKPVPYTSSEYTKGEPTASSNGQTPTPGSGDPTGKDSGSASRNLVEPSGNFVSSHHVSGSSNVASTCNTTPGARCAITFTRNGITKSLPSKTVDAGGAAYWDWQPEDIGLTVGTWQIKAVAKSGTQTKTASDALNITVK
jgi:hypothetical protein